MTVTDRMPAGTVTAPVAWSTVPADAVAMSLTKAGNSKATGPEGSPVSWSVTTSPQPAIVTPIRRPSVAEKLETAIRRPDPARRPTLSGQARVKRPTRGTGGSR